MKKSVFMAAIAVVALVAVPSFAAQSKPHSDKGKDCKAVVDRIPHGGKKVNGTSPREAAWAACLSGHWKSRAQLRARRVHGLAVFFNNFAFGGNENHRH
jgi:hypothetical protein